MSWRARERKQHKQVPTQESTRVLVNKIVAGFSHEFDPYEKVHITYDKERFGKNSPYLISIRGNRVHFYPFEE